jgi:hypothetical protein
METAFGLYNFRLFWLNDQDMVAECGPEPKFADGK